MKGQITCKQHAEMQYTMVLELVAIIMVIANANGYFGQWCMVTFRSIANFYVCSLDQYMNTSSCLKDVKCLFSVSDKTCIYHPSQNMTVAELTVVL